MLLELSPEILQRRGHRVEAQWPVAAEGASLHIYNNPANAAFRAANPDPHNLTDGPEEIFFPLREVDE